jgi:hypothetical protein
MRPKLYMLKHFENQLKAIPIHVIKAISQNTIDQRPLS